MIQSVKRLVRIRHLLSVVDRVSALEIEKARLGNRLREQNSELRRLQEQNEHLSERLQEQNEHLSGLLQEQDKRLQGQDKVLGRRFQTLQNRTEQRLNQAERQLEYVADRFDILSSSLEVPREFVEEFSEWKKRNPVPERPLITVAVATYNRARLLAERCIPSILGQTYDNLELIVVGDNCTDETEELLGRIKDPRLKFVNLSTRGSYPEDPVRRWMVAGTPAMNRALEMSRGHFITHLDDDDEYVPDRLEKLVAFASENGYDFVWHPYWWENTKGEWRLNEAPDFAYSRVTTSSIFYASWFKKIHWDIDAHRLQEPGDWNRLRKFKYVGPVTGRYPEPLLNHYRQRQRS